MGQSGLRSDIFEFLGSVFPTPYIFPFPPSLMTIKNKAALAELFGEVCFRDGLLIWGKEVNLTLFRIAPLSGKPYKRWGEPYQ